jgi:thiamine biosynthesis lipoprotein
MIDPPSGLTNTPEAFSITIPAMGATIDVRWVGVDSSELSQASEIGKAIETQIDHWTEVMSDYQQDSQVNRFCRQADDCQWHAPSADLWRVLECSDQWNRWSLGAFDASLGALTRLRRSKSQPSDIQWQQARLCCGWENIEWDLQGRQIRFKRPGIRFDFGAIGKGFAVDQTAQQLKELGIQSYCVNASGNMALGASPKPTAAGWPVEIGLVDSPDRSLRSVRLVDCGIATSGDLHQKLRDRPQPNTPGASVKSSHILDPQKQLGVVGSQMATVITDNATNADAFATACCVHLARGTLNNWLSGLENGQTNYPSDFEIWVQSVQVPGQTPTLIHWS